MAEKFIELVNGKLTQNEALVTSVGAGDGGKIVALDSAGKLDLSLLPTGVGPDIVIIEASENINAGDYINIWNDLGIVKVRLADNSNGRDAHGFVMTAVTSGNNADVYQSGVNDGLSGLTIGSRYYLGTAGGVTATPPVSPAADISQFLGVAISATELKTNIDDCVVLT